MDSVSGLIELHLAGQHDQSSHGRGRGGAARGALPDDLEKLSNELNNTFGSDTVRRINEAGHNVTDYNLRDKDGNLTGKPVPGSDSWRDAHGISKDVYDSRPVKRWDSPKDPVFDEMYGNDAQQKTFAKKLANQSDGFIMERKPLPGAEERFGPIPPQARPDNKVVVDQRAKARREREVATAEKRIAQLETYTGDDIVRERQTRVNRLKRELAETKIAEADEIVAKPKAKLDKAEESLKKAEASGDESRISEAKLNRAIAKAEFQDANNRAKLIRRDDRHAAIGIVQQELNGANAALARAKADPNKALQNAKDAAASNLEKKQAALDKTAVKYAFPPGKGSASRMEAHQDPTNIKNLTEGKGKVYFVMEGQIKADSVLTAIKKEDPTAAVVSVPSVTAWNQEEVSWATKTFFKGRDVVLIPDADGVTNPAVVKQAKTLQGRMINDGAGRVFVASPPLIKNKRGKLEVEDIWYPTGVKDGRKGVDDHLGLGKGTLGDLRFNDTPGAKFDLSKETGARKIRPNAQANATRALQSISDLAGENGIQRISRDSVVKHSGLPDTSTKDALGLLEKKGYIKQHHLFDPKALGRNRREPAMEFDEMKRITRKAGVGLPDLSKKYVLDDDRHEVAPIIEILDKRFITKPGPSKNLKSVFNELQTSDRIVRTPEGAARYGVSIGQKIPGAELSISGLIQLSSLPWCEFHNQCHSPTDGKFCPGKGGPGRIREAKDPKAAAAEEKKYIAQQRAGEKVLGTADKFHDTKSAHNWGEKHWGEYVNKLPKDQKKAINDYVFIGDISQKIRSKNIDDATREQMEAFDKVFENAPRVPKDIVVHRGMKFSPPPGNPVAKGIVDGSLVGKTIRDPAYMSSSLEQRVATKYASVKGGAAKTEVAPDDWKVRMELKVPAGSKAAFVSAGVWHGKSGPVGRAYSLSELTFPRNTGIKVVSISEPDKDGFRTVRGEIVQ